MNQYVTWLSDKNGLIPHDFCSPSWFSEGWNQGMGYPIFRQTYNMAVTWHEAPELHKPRHGTYDQDWSAAVMIRAWIQRHQMCGPDEHLRSNQPQIPFGNQTWLARKSPMELCSWESHQTKCWIFQQAMAGRSIQALFRRVPQWVSNLRGHLRLSQCRWWRLFGIATHWGRLRLTQGHHRKEVPPGSIMSPTKISLLGTRISETSISHIFGLWRPMYMYIYIHIYIYTYIYINLCVCFDYIPLNQHFPEWIRRWTPLRQWFFWTIRAPGHADTPGTLLTAGLGTFTVDLASATKVSWENHL